MYSERLRHEKCILIFLLQASRFKNLEKKKKEKKRKFLTGARKSLRKLLIRWFCLARERLKIFAFFISNESNVAITLFDIVGLDQIKLFSTLVLVEKKREKKHLHVTSIFCWLCDRNRNGDEWKERILCLGFNHWSRWHLFDFCPQKDKPSRFAPSASSSCFEQNRESQPPLI